MADSSNGDLRDQTDKGQELGGGPQTDGALSAEDQAWILELAKRWRSHQGDGLKLRHDMGRQINERIGPPGKRQERGQQVVSKIAEKAGVHVSEISRMRKFAIRFPDYEGFQNDPEGAKTWSAVKKRIAAPDAGSGSEGTAGESIRLQLRSLKRAQEAFANAERITGETERQALQDQLKVLVTLILSRTGIAFTFEAQGEIYVLRTVSPTGEGTGPGKEVTDKQQSEASPSEAQSAPLHIPNASAGEPEPSGGILPEPSPCAT